MSACTRKKNIQRATNDRRENVWVNPVLAKGRSGQPLRLTSQGERKVGNEECMERSGVSEGARIRTAGERGTKEGIKEGRAKLPRRPSLVSHPFSAHKEEIGAPP